ncbi:MAG: hypothetical protein IKF11_07300 [Methanobrevibacter sp.]|nr:hypothetical protein [Methanobrevibacter sp.]
MGTYWYGQMNIKGKSKDLNKFEEKYPQIHQFSLNLIFGHGLMNINAPKAK